jgi:hypothetical protein
MAISWEARAKSVESRDANEKKHHSFTKQPSLTP